MSRVGDALVGRLVRKLETAQEGRARAQEDERKARELVAKLRRALKTERGRRVTAERDLRDEKGRHAVTYRRWAQEQQRADGLAAELAEVESKAKVG